ncbi:hypothetical protein J2Z21_001204 [Streptomyces griseochromogenes]|uniref:Uncharacterized protein n=1 Tax=Streptomyces griseochromogenes TaxID=68214 RepID=A0A1B1AU47_9ACTN|nr:hypothetical protein [Streptomyces griseochromogenes]ANP50093.1 hypothetical protein AVL59_11155 [Streptomyces griseochromogenes]MBP2048280.1 hypothetical protein [Streptomyces griseochromogenes]
MRKVLPLVVTGLLALSACQFAGHDDAADEARGLNTMDAFPLHPYLPDPSSDRGKTIATAQWILAKKCMVRLDFAGFSTLNTRTVESTYPVRRGHLGSSGTVGDDSPYGVDDPDRAAEHGYRNRKQEDSSQPLEWPADQYVALTGTFDSGDSHRAHGHPIPEGGCLGQATRRLYGSPPKAAKANGVRLTGTSSLPLELWYESYKAARKDPAWKKAERTWSACMKEKGFRYSDPDAASLDSAWFRTQKPSDRERETAAADARCKLDSDYITTVHAVEARAQKTAIGKHKKDLDAVRAAQERAVENARKVIAQAS